MKKKLLVLLCALLIIPMLYIPTEARDFGEWESKFGFQAHVGNASYLDDGAIMQGFGGAWYSKPVTNQVGIKFQMNKKVGNYAFIFGLMNKPDVGWNLNGKEAQGIVVQVRSWVSEEGVSANIFKVTGQGEKGVEQIGAINSKILPMNTDHTLSFYQKSGKWFVSLDGDKSVEMDASGLNFGSKMYLAAGNSYNENDNYARAKDLQMSIHSVLVDDEMPSSYYAFEEPVVGGWQIVRGYGKGGADNGKPLALVDGKVVMEGYGGIAYVERPIKNAVAVDFQLNEFDVKKTYYFTFGLVNKEKVFYNANGGESEGITVRISSFYNKQGMNVDVWYVSQAGAECLGTLRTTKASKDLTHTLAIFKEDGKWYVGINGEQKLSVDLDVELGETSYLVAGASALKELKMSVLKVYVDDEVTDKMKEGLLKASVVSTNASGEEYGPGGTSFELQDFWGQLRTAAKTGNLGNLLLAMAKSLAWYQWLLIAGIGVGIAGTVVVFVKRKKGKQE